MGVRYGEGRLVRQYRSFQAILEGLLLNALVLASNGYAFCLMLRSMLERWHLAGSLDLAGLLMIGFFAAAAAYAVIVGFRGLARSDAVGFFAVIVAGIMLAAFVLARLPDGLSSLATKEAVRAGQPVFGAWPNKDAFGPLLLLAVGWWHSAPGRGMLIQRVVASRDEASAMKTVGAFAALHYVVRPWSWYVVGAAALLYLPAGANPEGALPLIAGRLLPPGFFGMILAVTTLAFMGCVNSRLNFGASYIVNDVAAPLLPSVGPVWMRLIEIATVIALTISAVFLVRAGIVSQIRALYQFLAMMLAGTGFVAIARWYWWRTTIVCEIASLNSAVVVAGVAALLFDIARPTEFAEAVAVNFLVGAVTTVVAALVGRPTASEVVRHFNDKVSPGGPGWPPLGSREANAFGILATRWLLATGALFAIVAAGSRLLALAYRDAAIALAAAGTCLLITAILPAKRLV